MNIISEKKYMMDIKVVQGGGSIIFRTPFRKYKMPIVPNLLALEKSYEHHFMKKQEGLKIMENLSLISFCVAFQKYKISTISNILAFKKLCEYYFTKKM